MKKVMVLMGGMSSERDISLMSGQGVIQALNRVGYDVIPYDLTGDIAAWTERLTGERPDVVFNALHGKYGEDGCVQGVLNLMHIPYTHSGILASAIGMDKAATRRVAESLGVPVPQGDLMTRATFTAGTEPIRPYVIKPNDEGSSAGVFIIRTDADRAAALAAWPADKMRLVEAYVPGRELSAAVLDGQGVGVVEIIPKTGYYNYANKYTAGAADHIIPAAIPPALYQETLKAAEIIHRGLGCRGVSRSDFRLDDQTDPAHPRLVFLEINTNPGMTELSLVPELARACLHLTYDQVVSRLVEEAACDA